MSLANLTSADIDFGKRIAARLRESGFGVKAVLWLYDDTADDWRLVIATDAVDRLGPRRTYLELLRLIPDVSGSAFQRMRIEVVSPNTPLLEALRSVFGATKSLEGARLQDTVVNGIRVPQAYLYEVRQ